MWKSSREDPPRPVGGGGGRVDLPPGMVGTFGTSESIKGHLRSSYVLPSWADSVRCARAAHEGRREKSEAFLKLRLAFECERIPRSTEDEQCVFMCMRKNVAEYAMGVSMLPAALHSQRNAGPPHTS